MAGLIDVGILKPELAGSFAAGYRGAEEQRNALAQRQQQAAQAEQQLASGRQKLQMDEMTMQRMQEDRAALTGLRAKLRAAGQSDDPQVFFRVLAESDDPNIMMKGIEGLQRYRALEAYDRQYGGGAVMPSSAPGAMVAPAAPAELAAGAQPEPMTPVPGVVSTSRVPGVVTAPITAPTGTMREIAPGGGMGAEMPLAPANALAPAAAAPVNAMVAAQPAAPAPASDVNALTRRYNMASRAGSPDAPVLLKQIEAALRGDQNRPMAVSPGQVVIDPRTGQQIFSAPGKTTLSDRFVPVGRLVFDRETQQYISPSQAQLAQSQERPAAAAAPGGKAPAGYRFTPTGDLEPIPGGPAARAAEVKPLTPAQQDARRDKVGKEFKLAQGALQTTQDVLDSIAFVKSEPGLSRATGFSGTMLPSFPEGKAASAETRLANLKGKITALGKAAAAATGAIGSIATVEWKILSDQIAAIDPVKGIGPLLDQIDLVETQAKGALERIRDGYQRQFGEDFERFPQYSDLPPPKSSFKPPASARGAAPAAPAAPAKAGPSVSNW